MRGKKLTEKDYATAKQYAVLGFAVKDIARMLKVSPQRASMGELKEVIQLGYDSLRAKISKEVIAAATDGGQQDRALLVKRLRLFETSIEIKKPESMKDIKELLADALVLYADNQISDNKLRAFEAACNSYAKLVELSDLEERVLAIEEGR